MTDIQLSHKTARPKDSTHSDDDSEHNERYSIPQNKDITEHPYTPLHGEKDNKNVSTMPTRNVKELSQIFAPSHESGHGTSNKEQYENDSSEPKTDEKGLSNVTAHSYESVHTANDGEHHKCPKPKDKIKSPHSYVPIKTEDSDGEYYDSVSVPKSANFSTIDIADNNKTSTDSKVKLPARSKFKLPRKVIICVVIGISISVLVSVLSAVVVYHVMNDKIETSERDRLTQRVQDLRKEDLQTEEINALRNELSETKDKLVKLINVLEEENIIDADAIRMDSGDFESTSHGVTGAYN